MWPIIIGINIMARLKANLSVKRAFDTDIGDITPICCTEAHPDDVFQGNTTMMVRMASLAQPLMHPVDIYTGTFYQSYESLWELAGGVKTFGEFITGQNKDTTVNSETVPKITATPAEGTILDYLGVPTGVSQSVNKVKLAMYYAICNEFFRDKQINAEDTTIIDATPKKCQFSPDYYYGARPSPQMGDAVTLPVGDSAPVQSDATIAGQQLSIKQPDVGTDDYWMDSSTSALKSTATAATTGHAHLTADLSAATGITVDQLFEYIGLQKYASARAMFGGSYPEWLKYYGVIPLDGRLGIPELVSMSRTTMSVNPVFATDGANLGDFAGQGYASMKSNTYRKYVPEHGFFMTLMWAKPRNLHIDSKHRSWLRTDKEDFYTRELADIGMMEITDEELYPGGGTTVFGYRPRYSEYLHDLSGVSGSLRSTKNDMHMGRDLAGIPNLNSSYLEIDETTVRRPQNDTLEKGLMCYARVNQVARRPMRIRKIKQKIL
jgi:hypothetical protein